MKKSVRLLAVILLFSTLFCTVALTIFAQQPTTQSEHTENNESTPNENSQGIIWENDDETIENEGSPNTMPPSQEAQSITGTGIPGDVNGDGIVNNIDAILLHRFVSSEDVQVDADALDINGNGQVNQEDVIALFKYISDWTSVSIGYGYGWALECAHETEYIPAVSASCLQDGNIAHWRCKLCDATFLEENCENIISDAEIVISAYSQHNFNSWLTLSDPSCTEKGLKKRTCSKCEYSEIAEVDAKEHFVDYYEIDQEPTCTAAGTKVGICALCDNLVTKEVPNLGHQAGNPMDNSQEMCGDRAVGTINCTRCNEILSTYGHDYTTTIIDSTCTEDGKLIKECTRCSKTEITILAYKGHAEGFLVTVKEATCNEPGAMALACLYCDYIFEETTYETPQRDHSYTITEKEEAYLFYCENCSHSYTESKEALRVYKVSFVSEYGESILDKYVLEGSKISLPLLSEKGFSFFGWFKDQECTVIFDDEQISNDTTLYAKWEVQNDSKGDNNILSNVAEDFSFIIKNYNLNFLSSINDYILILDLQNNSIPVQAEELEDGLYKISPLENYKKGELYKIILKGDTEFKDYNGNELWITIKKGTSHNVTIRPGVVKINNADIFAITEGDENSWYIMLYDDTLNVNNFFVIYDGDENNVIYSGKVYEEGIFDKYHIYRIDELSNDEISEVFADIDIHYEGIAQLGDFIPDESIMENAKAEFIQSALYKQIETAAMTFSHLSSDGKYYYDYHYPVVNLDFRRDGSSIIFTFTVDVTFGRLDTDTREVKDLYTVTFKIKNETTFNVTANAQSTKRYEFLFSPVNTTTIGIYAKTGGKIVNDARLDYFKEIFIASEASGETEALDKTSAKYEKKNPLGSIPLFAVPGISINVNIYNVFSFEAVGEIGIEVITKINPTVGIANYGNGVKVIKDFDYLMSVNAYARANLRVSDRLGANVEFSLIGMIHIAAGVEVGPYAEAGGLLNINVEWGSDTAFNFGATAGGYIEAGVDVEAYAALKITTLIFKIKIYQNRWDLYKTTFVLFSVGDKELPIKFETAEKNIEETADLLYEIDLSKSIGTQVIYQNLETMKTSTKNVDVKYEIVDNPDYATINKKGVLVLNEKVGDQTLVDLKLKVSYKTLFKIINVRIYVEHDYADEFTCHDRTCRYCGYLCKATTPHVYSDWEAIAEGACSPTPYSMRICFDCRVCEFDGINAEEAQHHDYQPILSESLEPTCIADGYLVYRCARENCQSETKIALLQKYGEHELIWIDNGETHYQHCKRVGCGYNTKATEHIAQNTATCTEEQTCKYCGHVIEQALDHEYETIPAKDPTCTESGHFSYIECSRCGYRDGYTEISALNHSYTIQWKWNGFDSVLVIARCANGHNEEHTVKPTSKTITKPTCTTPGERKHTATIKIDGIEYSDTIIETLAPLGHNIAYVAPKEPTCTSVGWYAHEICTRSTCTHSTKIEIKELPHAGGEATCTAKAICDMCHNEYGTKLEHSYGTEYVGSKDGHFHKCACGKKDKVLAHSPDRNEPTENEAVSCLICDYIIAPATGHVKHEYTILENDDTHHWYRCNQCSEIQNKTAHRSDSPATCTAKAKCEVCHVVYGNYGAHNDTIHSNDKMHWYVCSECYRIDEKEEHYGGTSTCTELAVCIKCEKTYGEKNPHDFNAQWSSDAENHYKACPCGAVESVSPHVPDRNMPTETEDVKCLICEYIMVPKTGHKNHNYTILQHNETEHWYKCDGCSQKTNKTAHNGGTATCDEKAVCATCHAHYGDEPDHQYITKHNETSHWFECEKCDFIGVILAHEGGYPTCERKAKCDICGAEYGEISEHEYTDNYDAYYHWLECKNCKGTKDKTTHTGGTATCTAKAKCSVCGKTYGDLLEHTPGADDGDCTTPIKCSVCGKTTTEGADNHTGGTATCTAKAECSVCGKTYGALLVHTPCADDGDCTTPIKCSVCGKTTTEGANNHIGGTATCAAKAKCSVCGKTYGDLLEHTPGADDGDCTTPIKCSVCGKTTTEGADNHTGGTATCTAKAKCSVCGKTYGDLLEHTPVADDGDCTTPIKCSVCGKTYGDLLEHTPGADDGDCTTPIKCSVCGKTTTEGANNHIGGTATCKDQAKCDACGTSYGELTTDHVPNEDDGDCTTPIKCSVCGKTITEGADNHTGGTATCTAKAKCSVCGKTYGDLLEHTPGADDGDCTTAITCSECGKITVNVKEHNFGANAAYEYNDNGHWKICANDGCFVTTESSDTQPHSFGEWYIPKHDNNSHARECCCGKLEWSRHTPDADDNDCTTSVLCVVCNLTAIKPNLTHDFDTSYVNDGTQHWHICANEGCSATDEKENHNYGKWFIDENDPSMHKHTCVSCGYFESKSHDFVNGGYKSSETHHWKQCWYCDAEDAGNKEQHIGTVATCTEKSICYTCDNAYGQVDPNNHNYELKYNDEYHFDRCSRCLNERNITKHQPDYRIDTEKEEHVGDKVYYHTYIEYCQGCDYSKELSTAHILEHNSAIAYGGEEATCEGSGKLAGLRCEHCDFIYFEPIEIPAKGHSMKSGSWMDMLPPSCSQEGYLAHGKCEWCLCDLDAEGHRLEDIAIPKINHQLKRTSDGSIIEINTNLVYSLSDYPEFVANCYGVPPTDTTQGKSTFCCESCLKTIFVDVIGHYFEMRYDETNHWLQCAVLDCGLQKDSQAHEIIEKQCTVCDFCQSSLSFTLSADGSSYIVSGIGDETGTDIVIPSLYKGKPVVAIGEGAFEECRNLMSVIIPASVTVIGDSAFAFCTNLAYVNIPYGVTNIGVKAFTYCYDLTEIALPGSVTEIGDRAFALSGLTNITIPDSVISIGANAFHYCDDLSSVTIGSNVQSIGQGAFDSNENLVSIVIPASVLSMDRAVFYDCPALTVYCEAESQPYGWDEYWSGYTPVVWNCKSNPVADDGNIYFILDGVRYALKNAIATVVAQPKNIQTANIANTILYKGVDYRVTSIGDSAFADCDSLTSVTIPDSVTTIGDEAYSYCRSLTSVTIPYSVTVIGDDAFADCFSLTSVTIGNSVTTIGDYAFAWCDSLTSVIIPDSVTVIGDYAFYNCHRLTSVTIPDSVTTIGVGAFSECHSLTSILVAEENTAYRSIDENLYSKDGKTLIQYAIGKTDSHFTIPNSVTTIGDRAFADCYSLTSVTIPYSVTTIGDDAFAWCDSLTSVTIGDSVTTIGDDAFYSCDSLTSVYYMGTAAEWNEITIGQYNTNLTGATRYYYSETAPVTVGNFWHYGEDGEIEIWTEYVGPVYSTGLEFTSNSDGTCYVSGIGTCKDADIVIPPVSPEGDTVTGIGDGAFYNCDSLTSVTIPDSVTTIGYRAFADCDSLTSILVEEENTVYRSIDGNLYSKDGKTLIQYAIGKTDSHFTIPDSVTTIGDSVFYWCQSLTSVTIPDSVSTIGDDAFSYCRSLTSVTIGDSVTTIGYRAFYDCYRLTSILVAEENTAYRSIDGNLYSKDGKTLIQYAIGKTDSHFTIPDSVTKIGDYAFAWCYSLTSVTIPDSVTVIDDWAFYGCTSLTSVTIGDSVTTIGNAAFYYCISLTSVTIGGSVTTIGDAAFAWCDSLAKIYYKGSASDWERISIHSSNSSLIRATRYYYSETQPTEHGLFWKYDANNEIVLITICEDGDSDHACDYCGGSFGECVDANQDHYCDYCGRSFGECVDANQDHHCDYCGRSFGECVDANQDHYCDYCGRSFGECVDANQDHHCDYCGLSFGECVDANQDHYCDYCSAPVTYCYDKNHDRKCDICKKTVACEHGADANEDDKCDYCGAAFSCPLSEHADWNQDGLCDGCKFLLDNTKFPWDNGNLTFEMTNHSNGQELPSGCQNWMAGQSTGKTSLTQIAAAERNAKALAATKLTVNYTFLPDNDPTYSWSKNFNRIQTDQDKGIYSDMYCNFVYDMVGAHLAGCFANLKTERYTNYFNFAGDEDYGTTVGDSEGYMYEYMTSLSISEDKMYLVASDYFIDLVRAFYVVPVNVTMLEELDTSLPKTPADFAAMVSANEWTYDKLIAYSANYGDAYVQSDKKGFAIAEHSMSSAGLLYTSSVRFYTDERKLPGNTFVFDGTNSPYSYEATNQKLLDFAAALDNMMAQPGVVRFTKSDNGGLASNLLYIREQFTTNKVLFGGVIMLGSLEYQDYQNMKTQGGKGFLVAPVPLYTDYNEATGDIYSTQIHNIGRIGAISVKSEKFSECSAFLNYQSTHSRNVLDTYYEQELLYSVVGGGSIDTALLEANKEMLDLLRDNVHSGFQKAYEDSSALFDNGTLVTTPDDGQKKFINLKWHDVFDRKHYQMGNNIAAYYCSLKDAKEVAMKNLFCNGITMLPE